MFGLLNRLLGHLADRSAIRLDGQGQSIDAADD
jgi:hypothetical protein